MAALVEVRAVIRRELADRVVHALKHAGVPRLTVARVHAIGSGVDPAREQISLDEGTAYTDKCLVQFICDETECERYITCLADAAHTGRQGDGIVSVIPVWSVRKIRTGASGPAALR